MDLLMIFMLWVSIQFVATYLGYYYPSYKATYNYDIDVRYIVLLLIVSPISEDMIFRYVLYDLLKKLFNGRMFICCLIQAILFGFVHGTVVHTVSGFFIGFYLSLLYERYNNIFVPIFYHMLFNGLSLLLGYVIPVNIFMYCNYNDYIMFNISCITIAIIILYNCFVVFKKNK